MEIYQDNLTEKQKKNTKRPVNGKKPKQPFRFINDSYRNRSTPTWEKIVFILIGVIGLNVANYIVSFLRITTTFYDLGRTPFGQSLQRFLTYLIVLIGFLLLIFLDQHASYKKIFKDFASFKPYVYGLIGCLLLYIVNVVFNAIYSVTMPGIYGANNNQQRSVHKDVLFSPQPRSPKSGGDYKKRKRETCSVHLIQVSGKTLQG